MEEISEAWDDLLKRSEFDDVFSTAGFARAWWQAYGKSNVLKVVVVEDQSSTPRLIAPFYSNGLSPQTLRLIGDFRGDYNNVVFADGDKESLVSLLSWLRSYKEWELLLMQRVPGHAAILHHFPQACEAGSSGLGKLRCWMDVRGPLVYRSWQRQHPRIDEVVLAQLANLLATKNYRKHMNWFSARGTLEYRCVTEENEVRSVLNDFMELHIAEWASMGQRSLFLDSQNKVFYDLLVGELTPSGAVRLDVLTFDKKLVAAHFGFNWNKRVYYYKPSYDPAFLSHSPGKLLLAHIINSAAKEGARELDLLNGAEEYKLKYASDVRLTGTLKIHMSRLDAILGRIRGVNN